MKIAVTGLWHLGLVTAACLANAGYDVVGLDQDKNLIAELENSKTPIFEPGLDEMLEKCIAAKQLHYTSDLENLKNKDII